MTEMTETQNEAAPAPRALTRRQLEKLIVNRNARFDALSPAERRMAIARDVLAQLKKGRLVARADIYVNTMPGSTISVVGDAQEVADNPGLRCTVCAIGSAVVSAVGLFDQVPEFASLHDLAEQHYRYAYLSLFFSEEQQALMEAAFEMKLIGLASSSTPGVFRAIAFGQRYDTDDKRLRAIWRNVLRNGEFIP